MTPERERKREREKEKEREREQKKTKKSVRGDSFQVISLAEREKVEKTKIEVSLEVHGQGY